MQLRKMSKTKAKDPRVFLEQAMQMANEALWYAEDRGDESAILDAERSVQALRMEVRRLAESCGSDSIHRLCVESDARLKRIRMELRWML